MEPKYFKRHNNCIVDIDIFIIKKNLINSAFLYVYLEFLINKFISSWSIVRNTKLLTMSLTTYHF